MATRKLELDIRTKNAEQAIRELKDLGTTGERALNKLVKAGQPVPKSLKAVDAASRDAQSSIRGFADRLGPLGSALSALGPAGIAGAAGLTAMVGLGAGLFALTKRAAETADTIAKAARAADLSGETFQLLGRVFDEGGISSEKFNAAMLKFTRTIGDTKLGTGSLVTVLNKTDEAFVRQLQGTQSNEQALGLFIKRLTETTDANEKAALAGAAFGRVGTQIAAAVGDSSEAFDAAVEAQRRYGVITNENLARSESFNDTMARLSQVLTTTVQNALLENVDSLEKVAQAAINASVAVLDYLASWGDPSSTQGIKDRIREVRDEIAALPTGLAGAPFANELRDLEAEELRLLDLLKERRIAERDAAAASAQAAAVRVEGLGQVSKATEVASKAQREAAKHERDSERAAEQAAQRLIKLRDETAKAGLEGIDLVIAKREEELRESQRLLEEEKISQEQHAEEVVLIREKAAREITDIEEEEAEKRADEREREREKQGRDEQAAADRAAEEMARPFNNALENVQRGFGDLFTDVLREGKFTADTLGDLFRDSFARLGGELISQQITGPLFGALRAGLGLDDPTGADAATGGFGGGNLITNLLGGVGNLFGLGGGGASGILQGPTLSGGNLSDNPLSGGTGALGLGAGIGTLGIALAVVAAIESIFAISEINKNAKFLFDQNDRARAGKASLGTITGGVGNLLQLEGVGKQVDNFIGGSRSGKDALAFAVLTGFTGGFGTALVLAARQGTRGTATRKAFEEFIEGEKDTLLPNVFQRGLGTQQAFDRLENVNLRLGLPGFTKNHAAAYDPLTRTGIGFNEVVPDGTTGTGPYETNFTFAQRAVIGSHAARLGLSGAETGGVIGLSTAHRGLLGKKAGRDSARSLGGATDLLATLNEQGFDHAQTINLIRDAYLELGSPQQVFHELNKFFSDLENNDITVSNYRDAIMGLADAHFHDLGPGVHASRRAQELLDEAYTASGQTIDDLAGNLNVANLSFEEQERLLRDLGDQGVVSFERLQEVITGTAFAASLLLPTIQDVLTAAVNDPTLTNEALFAQFEEGVKIAVRDAVLQGFTEAVLESTFDAIFLEPIATGVNKIAERLAAGEITPEQASEEFNSLMTGINAALEEFGPFLADAAEAVRNFSVQLDNVTGTAPDADTLTTNRIAFDEGIQRAQLGITDPGRAALLNSADALEADFRARVALGIQVGGDLLEVERLYQLSRQDLIEQYNAQILDEQERAYEQALQAAEQSLKGISALITSLTASPSSPLATPIALQNAQSEFASLLTGARGGDLQAVDALPQAFQSVLGLAQQMFGSTTAFFDIFNGGLADLESILGLGPGKFIALDPGDRAIISSIDVGNLTLEAILAELEAQGVDITPGGSVSYDPDGTRVNPRTGEKEPVVVIADPATTGPSVTMIEGPVQMIAPEMQRLLTLVGHEIAGTNLALSERLEELLREQETHRKLLQSLVAAQSRGALVPVPARRS